MNLVTAEKALERYDVKPTQLISFRGAMSHSIRRKILTHEHLSSLGPITHIDRWFNHTEEEKNAHLDEVLASKFVLCPRGISPSSIRLFEVMELGRVPVILADEWVPPDGPAWSRFSIRIAESQLDQLPQIVRCREQQWEEMSARSRQAWEEWFGPGTRVTSAVAAAEEILYSRPATWSEKKALAKWKTHAGRSHLGWAFHQRLARKFRNAWERRISRSQQVTLW